MIILTIQMRRIILGGLALVLGIGVAQAQIPLLSERLMHIQKGLTSGQFGIVAQYFHPKLKGEWSTERMASVWNTLNYQLGGFTEWGEYKQDSTQWSQQGIQVIHQRILFQKGRLWLIISFNEKGDILGFFFSRDK